MARKSVETVQDAGAVAVPAGKTLAMAGAAAGTALAADAPATAGSAAGADAANMAAETVIVETTIVETVTTAVVVAETTPAEATPAPAVAVTATVEGYIDGLDSRWHVVGWARSLLRDEERLKVELLEGGSAVSSDMAMRFRGDLLDAKLGDGKYGFQLSIPTTLFDGMRHEFVVRVALPAEQAVLGRLEISLPSRLPKSAGVQETTSTVSAAKLVESVLGGSVAQPAQYLETYVQHLTKALDFVSREYDFATALALLYVHILRRRIDEGGLQTRLTRLSKNPEQLVDVVREVVQSDEAQSRIKKLSGYHLPDLEAIRAWTRLRPII